MSYKQVSGLRLIFSSLILLCMCLPASATPDTALFKALLERGDYVYKQKKGYTSFQRSLKYFDSAQILAEKSGDVKLLGQATFARGRVYDAWRVEPLKTIELFTQATKLFKEAGMEDRYFYAKHLIAHTYEKMGDSTRAVQVLLELIKEIAPKSEEWRAGQPMISEMAVIATEVGNYALADTILKNLTKREWIANNPETYNWLDHYFLAQARLDLFYRNKKQSPYPDSLVQAYKHISNIFDRSYYAQHLAPIWAKMGDYKQAYEFRTIAKELGQESIAGNDFEQMRLSLIKSQNAGEHRKLEFKSTISRSKIHVLWGLSALLLVITILSIYLCRRNKKYQEQSQNLQLLNKELDEQAGKVKVLNKEIQHRIKNNLYTIYSLLHMQQESTDNEEVIAHLETARMRIESVAALHDHLLAGGESVDFSTYLKVLVGKIVDCFADERKVITHISTESVALPLNTCFALSLILNEWITNSIKYAGNRNEMLEMEIRIANVAGEVCITYLDSGGLPQKSHIKSGLGTEIVRLLTAQIKGRLTHPENHPYHYNLCLKPKTDGNQD